MATLCKIFLICALVCVITGENVTDSGEKLQASDQLLLEKALSDDRFLKYQIQCALNKGPCDSLGKRLKQMMVPRLIMRNKCLDCSNEDIDLMRRLILLIQKKFPKEWRTLVASFVG